MNGFIKGKIALCIVILPLFGITVTTPVLAEIESFENECQPTLNVSSSSTYDYMIIQTTDLENAITSIKNWKESLDSSKIIITSWVSSNYRNIREKIGNEPILANGENEAGFQDNQTLIDEYTWAIMRYDHPVLYSKVKI